VDNNRPIVTISPVIKLAEGPDFAFGSRWALIQYHAWTDRNHFLDMTDADIKEYFRTWIELPASPWYVREQYGKENARHTRLGAPPQRKRARDAEEPKADASGAERAGDEDPQQEGSESAKSSDQEQDAQLSADTRVYKMLYKGNVAEVNQAEAAARKCKVHVGKHDFYKHTRCTSVAQEEQSALPAGVMNVNADSDDEDDYSSEQKEIAKEMDELRAAKHWINQEGWDASGEGRAVSHQTGKDVELRLDWAA
jgi:hypothetical protein